MKYRKCFYIILLFNIITNLIALRVDIENQKDRRNFFSIEEFGYIKDGKLKIVIEHFSFLEKDGAVNGNNRAGFVAFRATSESGMVNELHEEMKRLVNDMNGCPFDHENVFMKIVFSSKKTIKFPYHKEITIKPADEGLYEIVYVNCGVNPTSYKFSSEMYNPGPNYLSVGEAPLPTILFLFFAMFTGLLILWITILRKNKNYTHKIHHLMTVFLLLKILGVFCFAMDKHFVKSYGSSLAWNILYHIFRTMRATMFLLVVILIGTGWSLLKPALSDKERKILIIVIPLQLLANLFLLIADELPEGSSSFRYWEFLFLWIDITCCLAIIIPIWKHIKHLESMATIASKQHVNLAKLKKFRIILLSVIFFVYFTRFIVFVLGNTLNFKYQYWQDIARESATVIFYIVIGKMLYPAPNSDYLKIPAGDRDDYEGVTRSNSETFEDIDDPFDQDMFFEDEHQSEFGLSNNMSIEMSKK